MNTLRRLAYSPTLPRRIALTGGYSHDGANAVVARAIARARAQGYDAGWRDSRA